MNHPATDCILVINTGSSSIKFQIFLQNPELPCLVKGQVNHLGAGALFVAETQTGSRVPDLERMTLAADCNQNDAIRFILEWVAAYQPHWHINVVAHRVVHGGLKFTRSIKITADVYAYLQTLNPLAPLHQPHNLAAIEIISALMPDVTQIACFDTAFHATHQPLFTDYALPATIRDQGIRRYGFHGLSYEWIVHSLQQDEPELAQGRIIAAHLGNGASLCAIAKGVSIDTTMGMTALDGLPMGTRCGNLDPGAVIYMIRELGLSPAEAESILYNESGLLGLSEWTNDVSLLQDSDQPKAQFALDYFCLRAAQLMGMMAVALGGVDGLVFSGGIGENSAFVRNKIVDHLALLGSFATHIIPTNEERMMAMHALSLLEKI